MRLRPGFSIVELLTVVGMIAVLASLLLAVAGHINQMASRTSCQGQMHQIAQASLNYAMDNAEQLPFCNWNTDVNTEVQYGRGWLFSTTAYRPAGSLGGTWNTKMPPAAGVETGVIWPYVKNLRIYHCPADNTPEFWTGTEFMTSYLMNGAQCRYGCTPVHTPGLRITQFTSPDQSVFFWEALEQQFMGQNNTGCQWNDGSSSPTEENMSARHNIGANVACFDGHVEWWPKSTWTYWAQTPGSSNRLWCNPATKNGAGG